ncbi:hypothetical protein CYLTODRAFT_487700 [Cylindrobasidium torrendii FP15055 ss-10]|uniref:Uncharacterized protein n=1 Tax=Cylindrobasidium torrendii FP15055 ss-10 TaxID=1314674 RepID=A0A0D7BLC1_9AGAR|nr:hypothetical protein CYLTODRAFT_487700 [Cylindrobasidium torrendii FP15055 ss-10]
MLRASIRSFRGQAPFAARTMASTTISSSSPALTSQKFTLPEIPELLDANYLDVLLPSRKNNVPKADTTPSNPLMDALAADANKVRTWNGAEALASTLSDTLDAFNALTQHSDSDQMAVHLSKAWNEDANLTVRMIWQLRSIHDGKGEKEAFYRAWGWLYDNHPRTAIANLHLLCEPVCKISKKDKTPRGAHGYWKDLLNILVLATCSQLSDTSPKALHSFTPRKASATPVSTRGRGRGRGRGGRGGKSGRDRVDSDRVKIPTEEHNRIQQAEAKRQKTVVAEERSKLIQLRLTDPKYRALYITVARLFADQLAKDLAVLSHASSLTDTSERAGSLRQLSLVGKWAPSQGSSHDRWTNITTAIANLLYARREEIPMSFPSVLATPEISALERDTVLRSWFQRWVASPLRKVLDLPEPKMSANEWDQIKYSRVASICMKSNTDNFLKHDPEGFQRYLIDVENGKQSISGATLMPHQILYEITQVSQLDERDMSKTKTPLLLEFKKQMAETKARVLEQQWQTLVKRVADSGTLENSLAICDVSGSMGSIHCSGATTPIFPSVALSLLLARVAKPPFNDKFITFSSTPQFVTLPPSTLGSTVQTMVSSAWGMTTNFRAVFLDLLLPCAKAANVKQEDMVKRLFVFSDMQFDSSIRENPYDFAPAPAQPWETTYDAIEKAYAEAGYEVPQIVFWDLSTGGTREVTADRKGVAMMNGFSPAMLKVFMGEAEEEEDGFDKIEDVVGKPKEDEFTPLNVLKKSLMKASYDGLVVVD